ncbi:MAG: CRISPR-associated endonuclease Cas3'' [bacterium]
MNYYAHSREGRPQAEWQPLEEHLKAVADLAHKFAEPFGSGEWAWNAGWLHDVGKAAHEFQAYLLRENGLDDAEYDGAGGGRVNHSSAGAALAADRLKLPGRILAYLAAGHHAGLPDWYSSDTAHASLSARLPEGRADLARIESQAEAVLSRMQTLLHAPGFVKPDGLHLWMRLLYSSLVDADFLDTEAFMQPTESERRSGFLALPELKKLFDDHMIKKVQGSALTRVNAVRQEILAACREAAFQAPGVFSLTVPTGGGKTLSGMAFALDHALHHGKCRIIYVIPYTSIIEQTAGTLAGIFGRDNVVEHHSNLGPEKETQRSRLASENWDAPVIVTTNVQFFESLYAAKAGRCRKLHNIVNSVVILDEAQLLPPELLTPCVDAMSQLAKNYGATILLSTATQPALPGIGPVREIIPPTANLYDRLRRVEYHVPILQEAVPVAWDALAAELRKHEQVLCVVNTRRDCYDLFNAMPSGTIHLSALMCGRHRSAVIRLIRWRLKKGMPIRVVSTQLVEAGVDIDFPVVYRALAGLDSIAQVAGRCNREGRLNDKGAMGQVYVFVPPKPAPRGLLLKGEGTTRELCALPNFDPQAPESFTNYFRLFYAKVNDTGSRFRDLLVKDAADLHVQFRTAGADFRLIDDQAQRPVIVRYGKSSHLLTQLRFAGPTREIMRQLQRYTVNLPARMVDILLADGRLEEVAPRKSPGIVAQCNLKLYDAKIGLDVYRESLPVEDLMV